jgi:hypothetical protein
LAEQEAVHPFSPNFRSWPGAAFADLRPTQRLNLPAKFSTFGLRPPRQIQTIGQKQNFRRMGQIVSCLDEADAPHLNLGKV